MLVSLDGWINQPASLEGRNRFKNKITYNTCSWPGPIPRDPPSASALLILLLSAAHSLRACPLTTNTFVPLDPLDTIDLQDHGAPSAKDHKHPPSANQQPQSVSLAPHQAETIREVQEDRAGEEARSPRVSWVNGELQQHAGDLAAHITNSLNGNKMSQDDAIATAQDGAATTNAAADSGDVDVDASGDEDMDDDMMDKISSSPSIEDGGYPLPPAWPARVDSLRNSLSPYDPPTSPLASEARSSSPYVDLPEHPPLHPSDQQASKAPVGLLHPNHHPGEYAGPIDHRDYGCCNRDEHGDDG